MNKTLIWSLIIIIVLIGVVYYVLAGSNDTDQTSLNTTNTSDTKGEVVVSFTDATASIANVNDVSMKVNRVELYSESKGWITVASGEKEYKLLQLNKNKETQLYGRADMDADLYTRARVTLGEVVVQTKNSGNKVATVPSKNMDMDIVVIVDKGKTTSIKMDVLADKSVYTTSKGQYVFSPKVDVESRSNATVDTSSEGVVTFSGGTVDTNKSVGMDLDGTMKNDFTIDSKVKLDVNSSGGIIDLNLNSTGTSTLNSGSSSYLLNTEDEMYITANIVPMVEYVP